MEAVWRPAVCGHEILTVTSGGPSAHRPLQLDVSSTDAMHSVEQLPSSMGRTSVLQKLPLRPYLSSFGAVVNSCSANFSLFSADRVQSSPCIMHTGYAESSEEHYAAHLSMLEEDVGLQLSAESAEGAANFGNAPKADGSPPILCDAVSSEPSHMTSRDQLPVLAEQCDGAVNMLVAQMHLQGQPSTSFDPNMSLSGACAEYRLHCGADAHMMSENCDVMQPTLQQSSLGKDPLQQGSEILVCSSTAVAAAAAAAAAATLPSLRLTSSPCCTFPLPSALSQGIADSPALSAASSSGSSRHKSFSPLESGPVSILPLVDNPQIGLPCVSCATLAELIARQQAGPSINVKIIDCR